MTSPNPLRRFSRRRIALTAAIGGLLLVGGTGAAFAGTAAASDDDAGWVTVVDPSGHAADDDAPIRMTGSGDATPGTITTDDDCPYGSGSWTGAAEGESITGGTPTPTDAPTDGSDL